MMLLRIVLAGGTAGVLANVTGYLITGRLFHRCQARTPGTWRATESWRSYGCSAVLRVAAAIAIGCLYAAWGSPSVSIATGAIGRGALFGCLLWAATLLPVLLELSLFVNWHRGFVLGLLLDWLAVCALAGIAAALAAAGG